MKRKHSPVKKYQSKYADPNDKTSLNHLALAMAIIDPNPKKDMRSYILPEFFNQEESEKRMKEIDEIHARGDITEAEMIVWQEENKKHDEKIRRELKNFHNKKIFANSSKPVKVINKYAGTEEIYPTLKAACEEYELNYKTVLTLFSYYKKTKGTEKIKYHGLILEKLK